MQTDPNGNLLSSTKVTATVKRRRLAYLVEINATPGSPGTVKDTTGFANGTWLNVNDDVESISGNMAIVPPYTSIMQIGNVPPASCQIVLRNAAKYSPNRTDSTLYTQLRMDSGSGGIYQLPVRVWVGFYDDPSLTPAASTTLSAPLASETYRITSSATLGATLVIGCIVQVDSEQMAVTRVSAGTTYLSRGFNGTTIASHSAGATVSILGAMTRQFTGVVHSFREGSRGRTVVLTCFDRSYMLNQAKITSPSGATLITQDATADTIIAQYADALPASPGYLPVPSAQRTLDSGLYPVNFAWADDSSTWAEIAAVASADGGVAFFDKLGVLKFFNSQHYIGAASQYTFDTLNMGDLSVDYDYNAIFSETTATYSAQVVAPSQTIYALSETMIVPAGTIGSTLTTLAAAIASTTATSVSLTAASTFANGDYIVIDQEEMLITAGGGTTTLTVTRGTLGTTAATHLISANVYKVTAGTYSTVIQFYGPTTSVTTPTQITSTTGTGDWQAVTGGGTLLTDGITLSMTNYAQRSSVTFTNKSAFYAAYITKFQLFGTPVQGFPARKVVQTKTTVPSAIAKRSVRLAQNPYWQDEAQANGVVEMLADRWKTGRNIITLRDCPGVPQLELGDLVTVTEATALTSSVTAFVMRMTWDLGTGREPSFKQTLELADSASFYQDSNYFVVGTDALGATKKYYY